ncbi:hypothetical protein CIK05_01590 [Bdellovibrio sp. qaytius]|nr:hypothetical protein CIK05_01590 [Bdellovibrio sp. qaytius]
MKSLLTLGLLVFSQSVFAGNSLSTKIHNQYVSLRALGMGNAFTAVADDYTLIMYNPAGFAKKKNNEIQFSLLGAGGAKETVDFAKDVSDAGKTTGTDTDKANAISTVIDKYAGDTMGGRIQAAELFWIRKNWGFALIPVDLSLDVTIDKQLGPTVDLNVIKDSTLAIGGGGDVNKELSWGITVKGIHRLQVSEKLVALQLATEPNLVDADRASEGFTVDGDIGFLYSPSWFSKSVTRRVPAQASDTTVVKKGKSRKTEVKKPETVGTDGLSLTIDGASETAKVATSHEGASGTTVAASGTAEVASGTAEVASGTAEVVAEEPKKEEKKESKLIDVVEETYPLTFSLVARNVVGSKFAKEKLINKKATEAPDSLPQVFDVGSQYEFATFGSLTLRAMLDFKNLGHPEATTTAKTTHAGVEFDYSPSGWFKTQFRAGMNQGYYTAGTTLLLGFFNIEAATYGEEVGTKTTKVQNRVYAAKLGMNF